MVVRQDMRNNLMLMAFKHLLGVLIRANYYYVYDFSVLDLEYKWDEDLFDHKTQFKLDDASG